MRSTLKLIGGSISLFYLFLILLPLAAGAETTLLNKAFSTGQSETVDGVHITLEWGTEEKAKIAIDESSFIFDIGECRHIETLTICLSNIANNKFTITATKPVAKVSFTKQVDKTVLQLRETATFTTTIKNEGEEIARDVFFQDTFPPDAFRIVKYSTCSKEENSIVWRGDFEKTDEKVCVYTVETLKPGKFESIAKLQYNEDGTIKELSSAKIRLDVDGKDVEPTLRSQRNTLAIGGTTGLDIDIINKESDESADVDVSLNLPLGLELRNTQAYRDIALSSTTTWHEQLEPAETKTRSFEIIAKQHGKYTIQLEIQYKDGLTITKNIKLQIDVPNTEQAKSMATTSSKPTTTQPLARPTTNVVRQPVQPQTQEPAAQTTIPRRTTSQQTAAQQPVQQQADDGTLAMEFSYINMIATMLLVLTLLVVPLYIVKKYRQKEVGEVHELTKENLEIKPPQEKTSFEITQKPSALKILQLNALRRKQNVPDYIKKFEKNGKL